MYTSYNNSEVVNNLEASTKYTEYLKTLSNGNISGLGGAGGGGGGYYNDSGGGGGQGGRRGTRRNNIQGSSPLLAISDNEVKFSNIFSPNESNALKLHLLQKTSSLPLLEQSDSNNARRGSDSGGVGEDDDGSVVHDESRLLARRRSTAIGLLHENRNNNNNASSRRKGDPVANILYSTIRHGAVANNNNNNNRTNDYDNPSADETLHTGSDSKVDYDPHEPLPAVDQIALRHELLNNIRAISRATYFEDLYTGKVRRNSGSPEAEILRLLENPDADVGRSVTAEKNVRDRTIPSKDTSLSRVDRWVKESSEASVQHAQNNNDTDDDRHASLYHASVWNEKKNEGGKQKKGKSVVGGGGGISDATTTESDAETASAYNKRTSKPTKYQTITSKSVNGNPVTEYESGSNKHFSRNTDRSIVSRSMGKPIIPPGIVETSSSYLQAKYLNDNNSHVYSKTINPQLLAVDTSGARRPFSFGFNSSSDELVPLSVSLPNVSRNVSNSYRSTPLPMHASVLQKHSVSKPENLNNSMANLSTGTTATRNINNKTRLDKRKMNAAAYNEQVGRRTMAHVQQQKSMAHAPPKARGRVIRPSDRAVPGLYSRLNMNQWVVKKVCFYVNGDELHPRFEYRFRQGKDIRDLDQLLDILTKRFPTLPTGARFIFTMDGYIISSLDELINESSYVVSSTKKFKAIKYGNGSGEGENLPDIRGNKKPGGVHKAHAGLSRKLSASDGNLHRSKRNAPFPSNQSFATQMSMNSFNSKSVSDVPKLVAHVIEEASSAAVALKNNSPLMAREPIRVINGSRPSLQSQVLLNTKTSQPFEDLVRDLALSVRVPQQPIGNCLKTLAGRQIRSYSQLRSELKAGQRAFFIYSENTKAAIASRSTTESTKYLSTNAKPIVKAALGKVNSNSSSDLSSYTKEEGKTRRKQQPQRRRRSHSPTASQRTHSRQTDSRSPSPYYNLKGK